MKLEKYQAWHRVIGLVLTVFITGLAITGILLNHAGRLGLDDRYLDYDWLLQWYDIQPSEPPVSFAVNTDWLSWFDGRLYFNDRELIRREESLAGVVEVGEMYIAVLESEILLLTPGGEVIEILAGVDGIPGQIKQSGRLGDEQIVINTAQGLFVSNAELESWQRLASPRGVEWSVPMQAPGELSATLLAAYRGQGLSMEKLILDLHSGRFFGSPGSLLLDVIAVLLVLSVISGLVMWYKKKKMLAALE